MMSQVASSRITNKFNVERMSTKERLWKAQLQTAQNFCLITTYSCRSILVKYSHKYKNALSSVKIGGRFYDKGNINQFI